MKKLLALLAAFALATGVAYAQDKKGDAKKDEKKAEKMEKKADKADKKKSEEKKK